MSPWRSKRQLLAEEQLRVAVAKAESDRTLRHVAIQLRSLQEEIDQLRAAMSQLGVTFEEDP